MQLSRHLLLAATLAGCGDDGQAIDAMPQHDADIDADIDAPIDAVSADARPDAPSVCDTEDRDDDYVPGMQKAGSNGYRVTLISSTPPIGMRGTYAWSVRVEDATPAPRDGLALTVFPFMPDHGHGSSAVTITPMGSDGVYQVADLSLFMAGYWTVRIAAREAAGMPELDAVTFRFCVR
ncbi:MAG: hypothetical protein SFX73_25315 [Kofleriaceae bacterium]|nr:hypothetical protein [Kofleriaceae bacterium]